LTHSGRKAIKGDGVNRREPEQELARLHAAAVYDTAQFEEKQNNRPHATKLYRRLVEEYFRFPLRESGEDPFGESALAQKNLHAKVNNSGLTLPALFRRSTQKAAAIKFDFFGHFIRASWLCSHDESSLQSPAAEMSATSDV